LDDAALERVIHVESCHTKHRQGQETQASTVVLFALALEHARFHAGYGMMKIQSSIAPVLKKYFRMNEVSLNVSDSNVCLACDLEKCSYKFALYKLKEKNDLLSDHDTKIRMLVQMPAYREVPKSHSSQKCQTNGETFPNRASGVVGNTLGQSDVEKVSVKEMQASTKAVVPQNKRFCSMKQKVRHKFVCIRIEKDRVKVKGRPRLPHRVNQASFQGFFDNHDWNILSLFDKGVSIKKESPNDTVVSELRKQQSKLMCLEANTRSAFEKPFLKRY
jgi:hypothetical protein